MEEKALIQSFSKKGYGVTQGVEIAHTVPGDEILYQLTRKKRLPKKGRLLQILTPSSSRVEPRCKHARMCGGCSWQQMSYSAQLEEKQSRVEKIFGVKPSPMIAAENPWNYRNKMEFTFSENRAGQKFLGLMIAQAEPYVFNLEECHLANSWFSKTVRDVFSWWENSTVQAYNPPKDSGSLRYLTLREGMRTGQKMVVLNVSGNAEYALNKKDLLAFVETVKSSLDDVSIFLRIHQTKKGRPTQFFEMHLHGKDHILETLHLDAGQFSFKISPISFFQPNTFGAEKLYNAALSFLDSAEVVYDLYCGTGTLGMVASKKARTVIGIELSKEAVIDAEENLERNHITNMKLFEGDVGKVLTELMSSADFESPDAVIVDPPRAGLDPLALQHLKTLAPSKIIYVSCNPLTQKENIDELINAGYKLEALQPVDQFPHTYHIENIALLSLSS